MTIGKTRKKNYAVKKKVTKKKAVKKVTMPTLNFCEVEILVKLALTLGNCHDHINYDVRAFFFGEILGVNFNTQVIFIMDDAIIGQEVYYTIRGIAADFDFHFETNDDCGCD